MQQTRKSRESGQALVLLVLAMVALLGFTALAVDGGMVYSDRRHAQNASDAASLAGGGTAAMSLDNSNVTYANWSCSSSAVINAMAQARAAAVSRAGDNNFTIDQDISDFNGVTTVCGNVPHIGWSDRYIDVKTNVTADTSTAFAHLLYPGPLRNTVEAVTRIRPRVSVAYGNAIVALSKTCPNSNTGGVHFDGTSDVIVTGGGIYSNACMVAGGSVDVDVSGGGITCMGNGCYTNNGGADLSPAPQAGDSEIPPESMVVDPPDCSVFTDSANDHTGGGTISPGWYHDIRVNSSNDDLTMQPGLYCLTGNFVANGGSITGNGVTIYLESGDFSTAGGIQINLSAPPMGACASGVCPPALEGVLIYLPQGNNGEVSLLGTSDSTYLGLVYAPSGTIEAGGSSSEISTINAQLIGYTVLLHGTTSIEVTFNAGEEPQNPPNLELYK